MLFWFDLNEKLNLRSQVYVFSSVGQKINKNPVVHNLLCAKRERKKKKNLCATNLSYDYFSQLYMIQNLDGCGQ